MIERVAVTREEQTVELNTCIRYSAQQRAAIDAAYSTCYDHS